MILQVFQENPGWWDIIIWPDWMPGWRILIAKQWMALSHVNKIDLDFGVCSLFFLTPKNHLTSHLSNFLCLECFSWRYHAKLPIIRLRKENNWKFYVDGLHLGPLSPSKIYNLYNHSKFETNNKTFSNRYTVYIYMYICSRSILPTIFRPISNTPFLVGICIDQLNWGHWGWIDLTT